MVIISCLYTTYVHTGCKYLCILFTFTNSSYLAVVPKADFASYIRVQFVLWHYFVFQGA